MTLVKPRPVSGFPEWLPAERIVEVRLLAIIREEFEKHGFSPIETPAVERVEVLSAKGIEAKEIYRLARLAAQADEDPLTDLALHFDLTVPTARYVAQHLGALTFPFRRYQIQKVWRGERPQAGRFREFTQADIDIIGRESLGPIADAEIPSVIAGIFSRFGLGDFVIRINNRKLLQGLIAEAMGADDTIPEDRLAAGLRAIDALEKVGPQRVGKDLATNAGMSAAAAAALVEKIGRPLGHGDGLSRLAARSRHRLVAEGIAELTTVAEAIDALGVDRRHWTIDPAIARGLDYYTGTVYETRITDHPDYGSVCSGGRYDDLASNYTRHKLPGVGISIGLTRLLARAFEDGLIHPGPATLAPVLVTSMDRNRMADYLALATDLRRAGIATEVFTEPRKFPAQLKYASQKGFTLALIAGDAEWQAATVRIKNLRTGGQSTSPRAELIDAVRAALADG